MKLEMHCCVHKDPPPSILSQIIPINTLPLRTLISKTLPLSLPEGQTPGRAKTILAGISNNNENDDNKSDKDSSLLGCYY
jgi:hypothetical protein